MKPSRIEDRIGMKCLKTRKRREERKEKEKRRRRRRGVSGKSPEREDETADDL